MERPAPGRYWIQVEASRLAGGSQTFAMAVSGQIVRVVASTMEECRVGPVLSPPPPPPPPPPPWTPPALTARIAGRASLVGYLADCGVFLDIDGDGVEDPDEPIAVTDWFGSFSMLAAPPGVLAAPVVSRDLARFPACVDSFTGLKPGLRGAYAPGVERPPDVTLVDGGVVTPHHRRRRARASRVQFLRRRRRSRGWRGVRSAPDVDVRRVDPATASAERSEGVELMLATAAVTNVVSSLAA